MTNLRPLDRILIKLTSGRFLLLIGLVIIVGLLLLNQPDVPVNERVPGEMWALLSAAAVFYFKKDDVPPNGD